MKNSGWELITVEQGKIITSHPLVYNTFSNESQNAFHVSTFCHIGDSRSFSNLQ